MIQDCLPQTNLTINFFSFVFILSCIKNSRVKRTLKTNVGLIKQQDMTDGAPVPISTTLGVR